MLLLIDNFDSFTYNIAQSFQQLGVGVEVLRPNQSFPQGTYSHIVIGPGPGSPELATYSLQVIKHFLDVVPILGICLGHQCIAHYFGGKVIPAPFPMHGKKSRITHDSKGVFTSLPPSFDVVRYHSLVACPKSLPQELICTAKTECGQIMGLRHQKHKIEGVQFHPDSVLTDHGLELFFNFINCT